MIYTSFDENTGQLQSIYVAAMNQYELPANVVAIDEDNKNISLYDGALQYISSGLIVDKQAMPCSADKTNVTADGVDFVTLSGVPIGAEVISDGIVLAVSDGSDVEIDYDLAGSYQLNVVLFPYLDWEVMVNAS